MPLSSQLLDIIACPETKSPLIYDLNNQELISVAANLAYPIRDDIPILLVDEARELSSKELEYWRKKSPKQG